MMTGTVQLVINADGTVRCIYVEELDLTALGPLAITRASHVEPDRCGQWLADLSPVGGPILGPFLKRSQALAAEQVWLNDRWLSAVV
jgi:hypothetical protein